MNAPPAPPPPAPPSRRLHNIQNSTNLPLDIVINIGTRLPVDQMVRLRVVSKQFKKIFSTDFVREHMDKIRKRFIFNTSNQGDEVVVKCCVLAPILIEEVTQAKTLEHTFSGHPFKLIGSCSGLVCCSYGVKVLIWNPSLRVLKTITPPLRILVRNPTLLGAFGYDSVRGDMKIIGNFVVGVGHGLMEVKSLEYSIRTGQWRDIPEFPRAPTGNSGYFVNDVVYWDTRSRDAAHPMPFTVTTFNLRDQRYGWLNHPLRPIDAPPVNERIVTTIGGGGEPVKDEGELALIYCLADEMVVHVLDENSAWTALYNIHMAAGPQDHNFHFPMHHSPHDLVLMKQNLSLFLCPPNALPNRICIIENLADGPGVNYTTVNYFETDCSPFSEAEREAGHIWWWYVGGGIALVLACAWIMKTTATNRN